MEELPPYTDVEMNKISEEYAGIDMDEDMLANDDLLGDTDSDNGDTLAKEATDKKTSTTEGQRTRDANGIEKQRMLAQRSEREDGATQEKTIAESSKEKAPEKQGKRKGGRTPDNRGSLASKKLAAQGRASPRGKISKTSRIPSMKNTTSRRLPLHEVYPSSTRNKKPSTASGLVGSQNPPSTRI